MASSSSYMHLQGILLNFDMLCPSLIPDSPLKHTWVRSRRTVQRNLILGWDSVKFWGYAQRTIESTTFVIDDNFLGIQESQEPSCLNKESVTILKQTLHNHQKFLFKTSINMLINHVSFLNIFFQTLRLYWNILALLSSIQISKNCLSCKKFADLYCISKIPAYTCETVREMLSNYASTQNFWRSHAIGLRLASFSLE